MLSRHLIAATATAFLLFPATAPADGHVSAETVVATVNGTDITLGHLIVLKQRLPEQYQQVPTDVLFEGILNQVVQQTLLTETVEGPSRLVTLTLENEERTLKAGEAVQAIVDEDVSEDDARAIYDAVEWGEEYNASHILVETEEEAQALVTELEGGADFAELAREKSTGPSGPNGGELGWFATGQMPAEPEKGIGDIGELVVEMYQPDSELHHPHLSRLPSNTANRLSARQWMQQLPGSRRMPKSRACPSKTSTHRF